MAGKRATMRKVFVPELNKELTEIELELAQSIAMSDPNATLKEKYDVLQKISAEMMEFFMSLADSDSSKD